MYIEHKQREKSQLSLPISHSSAQPNLKEEKNKMASSPLRSKTQFHARSISLPSISHPLIPQFNEILCRLKAPEATTSTSLPSISNRVSGLEDLSDCVDDLLLLPHTQQAFTQECNKKWADDALDGYLMLLDLCATTRDVFSQTKQNVQELISILRRRRDSDDLGRYLASGKKTKKVIQKSLKELKSMRNRSNVALLDDDHETLSTISMLKGVESVILAVFESLLSYVAGTKAQSKPSGWSLVSKLMHHKRAGCGGEELMNDFEKLEAELQSIISDKVNKSDQTMHVQNVQNHLMKMESTIQNLEEGLECLFRRLIKIRVSLLNILNN